MYKATGGRRSKVQQRRRISKQQRRSRRGDPADDDFDPDYVPQRTLASDPNHVPLLTTQEKEYLRLASLPQIASSRRHEVEGANNGGRRRGRRISRRRR